MLHVVSMSSNASFYYSESEESVKCETHFKGEKMWLYVALLEWFKISHTSITQQEIKVVLV